MKGFAIVLGLCLVLACPVAGAADTAEARKGCENCGMDLALSSRSRIVIIYADRSAAAVCSLHCAAALLKKHGSVHVHSLMVADYGTGELTDAAKATWVIGGAKKGVMTSQPKWAFVREEDARNFVKEHGGDVTPFDQGMKAATEEVENMEVPHEHGANMGHDVGHTHPGAQMLFNPALGDDIYHTHPAGMWMVNYKFMRMDMGGLRAGTKDVPADQVIPMQGTPFGFMMAPTRMTMDMHMVMAMYGVTDRLTLMGMATYLAYEMEMLMNMGMGMGNVREPPMRTSGIGDTEVRASSPDADPDNYGGQRIDGLIGVSITRGCFSAGVEGGVPLYQELNGLQLETDWLLTVGFQSMF